jgi:hypothetical protein
MLLKSRDTGGDEALEQELKRAEDEFTHAAAKRKVKDEAFRAALTPDEKSLLERHEAAESRYWAANKAAKEKAKSYSRESDYPSRWILMRAIELGWTPERFAAFDREVNQDNMRQAQKSERIGKKYQWLAYHELAARTFDHFPFHYRAVDDTQTYEGLWQKSLRDIDPSFLVKRAPADRPDNRTWWLPIDNPLPGVDGLDNWDWLAHRGSIPDFGPLLSLLRRADSTLWYPLQMYGEWKGRDDDQEKRGSPFRRQLTFALGSFVVQSDKVAAIIAALQQVEWTGTDVEGGDCYEQFLGEFPWAPSYREYNDHAAKAFTDPHNCENTQCRLLPGGLTPAAHTTMQHRHSGHGFDCSLAESVAGLMPSVWLARQMGLDEGFARPRS